MEQRIVRGTGRIIGVLLALSLVIGACDPSTVLQSLEGTAAATTDEQPTPVTRSEDGAGANDTREAGDTDASANVDAPSEDNALSAPDMPREEEVPVNPPARVLWSNDHETGDLSGWSAEGGGGEFNSDAGDAQASRDQAHSGAWSSKLVINRSGSTRLFRWAEPGATDKAYYSAWIYFPQRYQTASGWWNIFQFKSKSPSRNDPFWVVNVGNRSDGSMYLYLHDWINKRNYSQDLSNLPVGRWVKLEAYLDQSANGTGRLTFWQDGQQLWDLTGISTRYADGDNQWSINNYADSISPNPATIYVDDAVIRAATTEG